MTDLHISPRKLIRGLTAAVILLITLHAISQAIYVFAGKDAQFGLRRLTDLGRENNIPTWYASTSLLLCAALLYVIARFHRDAGHPYTRHWFGLSAIFTFLSLDEAASIHETTIPILQPVFAGADYLGGYLRYSWVALWALLVLAVGLAYLRFLHSLPAPTRAQFLIAGAVYVGGALGTEIIEGRIDRLYGLESTMHLLSVTVQESMEMLGVLLFVHALLSYIASKIGTISISLRSTPS